MVRKRRKVIGYLILIAIGAVLAGGALEIGHRHDVVALNTTHEQELEQAVRYERQHALETFEGKVAQLKQDLLDDLGLRCETLGVKEPDAAIIFDSNNEASIGRYQFQRETVIYYYKKLYGKDITRREAIEIAVDPDRAGPLALDIMFQDGYKHTDWYTCARKMDIKRKVENIKRITQE